MPTEETAGLSDEPKAPTLTNLSGIESWIEEREKRNAKPAEPETAPATETSTPPVVGPEAEAPDWYDAGLVDTNHGFLKGKKGDEVEKIVREAQKKIRETGERANNLERQLRQIEAERAAAATATSPASTVEPPAKTQDEDPRMAKVRELWWTDDNAARELLMQIQFDKAREIAGEEFDKRESARETKRSNEERGRVATEAAFAARDQIAEKYGVSSVIAESMIQRAMRHIAAAVESKSASGDTSAGGLWLVSDNYVIATEAEFGAPSGGATVVHADVPPPPTDRRDPPGSKDSAPPAQRRQAGGITPLSDEEKRSREILVRELKLRGKGAEKFLRKG